MCREDWMIVTMSLVTVMWVGPLILPSVSLSSLTPKTPKGNLPKEKMLLSKPECTSICAALQGLKCKDKGGSGSCHDIAEGCIHAPPQPPGHYLVEVDDMNPAQCVECGNQWLEWDRLRYYACGLGCWSHVYSFKVVHDPKFSYDKIV